MRLKRRRARAAQLLREIKKDEDGFSKKKNGDESINHEQIKISQT